MLWRYHVNRDPILAVTESKSRQYREQIIQFKVEGKDYTLEALVRRVDNPVRQMNFWECLDNLVSVLKAENRKTDIIPVTAKGT